MSSGRVAVAVEGRPTTDGRLIEHGALTFPDEPVPVTGPPREFLSSVLGSATNFGRDDGDGVVWCDITLMAGREVPLRYTPALDVRDPDFHRPDGDEGVLALRSARVASVHLLTGADRSAWAELNGTFER